MERSPFFGMIGQEHLCDALSRMLAQGTLPHALLFVGPEGIGKTAVAEMLSRAILEGKGRAHPDYAYLRRETDEKTGKPKSQISVRQVRDLTARLAQSPLRGCHVAFIEEADRLHAAAGNALLKTLEEPRGRTVIILRASSAESVVATIRSRCQVLRFTPVPRAAVVQSLVERGTGREEAARAAAVSLGCPGRAIRYIKDAAFRAGQETAAARLGMSDGPLAARLALAEEHKDAAAGEIDAWESVLRDRLLAALGLDEWSMYGRGGPSGGAKRHLAAFAALRESRDAIGRGGNPRTALEHVLLRL